MKTAFILLSMLLSAFGDEVQESFTGINNLFTAGLYREVSKTVKENVLVSPFSAEVALALALSGAEGPTAEEIRTTLHLPNNPDLILKTFKSLLTSLEHHDQDYHLRNVNKIYLNKNFAIKNDFRNTALSVFGADLENVEFSQSVEAAKTINDWVEKQTENKIHDLVDPANLNDFTRSILINALYFQANWTNQFKNYFTIKEKFHPTTKDVVQVEMMTDFENDYNYYASEELEASFLEMPFEGEEASITFVLPDAVDGLADLEQQIDQVFIKPNYTSAGVFVSIPKFKIESSLDFKEILGNMGVRKAFTPGEAEFSGISDDELVVNNFVQKTFIRVNEEGVEAAASDFEDTTDYSGTNITEYFLADHPFIFYIKIKELIVFVGKVLNPVF
ncbi:hypothetical protein MTP99_007243 [Tenebrio molitor]|nr:hypothetical protein MTP99_007243 [Tenebrio molitor]